jgi:hypothetical protein
LPGFDVGALLKAALGQIDSADSHVRSGAFVQAARQEIAALAAVPPIKADAESVLRRTARSLMTVKDSRIENARLALMSAADMLRTSPLNTVKQPEIPKIGSTDAPGG